MGPPAVAGSGSSVLLTAIAVPPWTVVVSDSQAREDSWARAQAVSSSTPRKAGSMVPVMTTTPAWPTARAAMVHDTSWPTTVHGPGPLAPPMLTGAGTTSVTLIPVADDGPVLVTVMV